MNRYLNRMVGQSWRSALMLTVTAVAIGAADAAQQRRATEEAAAAAVDTGPAYYTNSVLPVLKEFCLGCHSTAKHKGDLDLERFSSIGEARKEPKIWQMVVEQMSLGEMPPKDKPQPNNPQREQLLRWIEAVLNEVALERAGDPGPVLLRRLSNAEYTYSVRDLTGVATLDPAREFPVDGAAGEGFMNVGNSLVMSPSLVTKYLDSGKEIASHAMLLPDGLRFSAKNTRRDWTEELIGEIRALYARYTEKGGGTAVNLQGIKFDTRDGGVAPLEKYFATLLRERESGERVSERSSGLSPKYLGILRQALNDTTPSLLMEPLRRRWQSAKPGNAAALADEVVQWQRALWKFNSVGHIGKKGGPTAWLEPFSPVTFKQELRLKIPAPNERNEVVLYLAAGDAGDGNEGDTVVWEQPRFVAPGRPALLLRDVRNVVHELTERRAKTLASTEKALAAAADVSDAQGNLNVAEVSLKHAVDGDILSAWLDYLGLLRNGPIKIDSYFTNSLRRASGHDFINGWGNAETPNLMANSSDQHVRIPGNMKPHSVAVHPTPKLQAVVGWRSPVSATLKLEAKIQHAHPECGNGVTWAIDVRRGSTRQRLANGIAQGAKEVTGGPVEQVTVRAGDFVSLSIGPRDANHSCDLTSVDLIIETHGEKKLKWSLAKDVSPNVLAGNPHPDLLGNEGVWHFYTEPDKGQEIRTIIPAGSALAKWRAATNAGERAELARAVQALLTSPRPSKASPDQTLYDELFSLGGPLFARTTFAPRTQANMREAALPSPWGLDPAQFGKRNGDLSGAAHLYVAAPSIIEIRVPADLVAGCEFVTTGRIDAEASSASKSEGSVQLQVLTSKPSTVAGLRPAGVTEGEVMGPWYSNNRQVTHNAPLVVNQGSAAHQRIDASLEEFRQLFPAALCYTKIVPVDEVVTLTLHHREDHHYSRLMLDSADAAKLDRLWAELRYVSQDALTLVDVFDQLWQYATQDADPSVFEPLREPIRARAAAFRELLTNSEPKHIQAVLDFASNAYRRPITDAEKQELRDLYSALRKQELPHDESIRLMIARVLVAPAFLYKAEKPVPGTAQAPVNDWELATRLSYFLWSSAPDARLREAAAAGKLRNPDALAAEARRMAQDARIRRMATEFGTAWLHTYDFDELGEKSERHFPSFPGLREAMHEETIRFFTDFFQSDRPVLDIIDADYTFVNEALAKHYGIPGVTGPEWRRVEGIKKYFRGGVLGHATTLAKQSGASRTSPILRGNWVSEVLLGEKLPRPPKDVPQLPEDEAAETLTVRQLTERHVSDPRCAGCHQRIDPIGFSLEKFDAIGRYREHDLGNRPIDTKAKLVDGTRLEGVEGLREYLITKRRDAFLKQFCRKLLGYALGRATLYSDEPLLTTMAEELKRQDYRVSAAIEAIVRSRQFREIRGRDHASEG